MLSNQVRLKKKKLTIILKFENNLLIRLKYFENYQNIRYFLINRLFIIFKFCDSLKRD